MTHANRSSPVAGGDPGGATARRSACRLTFEADSRVVRVPLVSLGGGLYRVSWHVVSAVDGHQSAGEFVFTVGDSAVPEAAGALPGASTRPSPAATAATWILLAGWSIAFGAAVLAHATAGVAFPGQPRTWIRAGALSGLFALAVRTSFLPGQAALVAGLMLATAVGLVAVAAISLHGTRVALAGSLLPDPGSLRGDRYGRLVGRGDNPGPALATRQRGSILVRADATFHAGCRDGHRRRGVRH